MSIDVVDLRNFYAQRLGIVARRFVGRGIRRRFADTRGTSVLGVGYAIPYLGLFRGEAERCLAFMPAVQGVVKWPTNRPGLAALVDELELPLPDAAVDRVLMVHALEMAHDPTVLLREVWPTIERQGLTLVGLSIANLDDDAAVQLVLPFDPQSGGALDTALDEVRERFGSKSVVRAVLLGRPDPISMPMLPD